MSRFSRLLAWAFPSVPVADRARVLAAMEGRTTTPVPRLEGEADLGTGDTTGVCRASDPHTGRRPESEQPAPSSLEGHGTRSPVTPPSCETDLFWEPGIDAAFDLGDGRIEHLINRWQGDQS